MQLNDFSSRSEQYKAELMKLYGKRSTDNIADTAENNGGGKLPESDVLPEDEEIFGVDEDAPDDTTYSDYADAENRDSPDGETEYNNRYPAPDLTLTGSGELIPGNIIDTPPVYVSEESLGVGRGYIIVNVRAGDESTPIEDAIVMVTAIVNGSLLILAEGLTNSSGSTERLVLPAPDIRHSQAPDSVRRPYNLFDVSVTARGFFNARSVDVSVFDGITSVQDFSMIPVPLMMRSSDETLTYFNQEPDFGGASGR